MKQTTKFILVSLTLIIAWIIICIFPWLLIPVFLLYPLIKTYLILGLANAFMGEQSDKRKHNRFHINDDFIEGAVVSNTINKYNKK